MLTASKSGNNIILKSSNTGSFVLSRKKNSTVWEDWNGAGWGGVPVLVSSTNFTDYDLEDGVYQYRLTLTDAPLYDYSGCSAIGSDEIGWTFGNYTVPDGKFGEVLTSDDILYSFMWGIDLTASSGRTWKEAQTKKMIDWAVFQLEKALNIHIYQRTYYTDDEANEDIEETKFIKKIMGYTKRRNRKYNLILRQRPILEVTRFDFYSPVDSKIMSLLPWMRLDKYKGLINYYPKQSKTESYISYGAPWSYIFDASTYRNAFHVDYKTGYKNAEMIDEDLREILGKLVTLKMLNVVGDGLLAGFSSSSLSLDGLSESFSSTQSATSAYFGARIKVYQDDIKDYIAENKNKYGNFIIGSL